ncbi:MAG TPA: cytochrome c oxidase assembly protein [Puia sp.]|nr:cytochrome c oxidase assembly protein [Puia sp.]
MRMLSFILGFLILAACVAVPLPALDSRLPFSDHMLRHTTLLLLAAPLLAMAIPAKNFPGSRLAGLSRLTARMPVVAWLSGILVMWLWHIPAWYNATAGPGTGILSCAPLAPALFLHGNATAALAGPWISVSRAIPLLHDGSLLAAGFLFCWPVVTPYASYRLPPLRGVLYLASACICCSLLGLLITFAHPGTFRGVSMTDQQTGGMIMWIPCCVVYLTASMGLLLQWLSRKETVATVSI